MKDDKPFSAKTAKGINKRAKPAEPANPHCNKTYDITLKDGALFTGTFHAIRTKLKRNNHCERLRYRLDNGVTEEAKLLEPAINHLRSKKHIQYGKGK